MNYEIGPLYWRYVSTSLDGVDVVLATIDEHRVARWQV